MAYQDGDSPSYNWPKPQPPKYAEVFTGIHYLRSEIKIADIADGTSNTYMVGEKYINPDWYFTGQDPADDQSLYSGFNNDNSRSTSPTYNSPPRQDTSGYWNEGIWGSATPARSIWPSATGRCDGSTIRSTRPSTAAWATGTTGWRSTQRSFRADE